MASGHSLPQFNLSALGYEKKYFSKSSNEEINQFLQMCSSPTINKIQCMNANLHLNWNIQTCTGSHCSLLVRSRIRGWRIMGLSPSTPEVLPCRGGQTRSICGGLMSCSR
ncbi:UNVERIFIED_CONTAM: hypothetical protein NCL1_23532 [Trichonephila clavipes]